MKQEESAVKKKQEESAVKKREVLQPEREFVNGVEVKPPTEPPLITNAPTPGDPEVKKVVEVEKKKKLSTEVMNLAKQSAGSFYSSVRREIDYRKISPEYLRQMANELINFCEVLVEELNKRK